MAPGRYIVQTYDTSDSAVPLVSKNPGPESKIKDQKRKKQKTSSSTAAKTYDDESVQCHDYDDYLGSRNDIEDSSQRGQSSKSVYSDAIHRSSTADNSSQRGQSSKSVYSDAIHRSSTADDSSQRGQRSKSVHTVVDYVTLEG